MSASVLDHSFGDVLPKKTLDTEEMIPDQVMTKIPQPQKMETLRFDTPRRMNTRNYTLESTERSMKSSNGGGGSSAKPRVPSQNRFGSSPSYQQGQKKKVPEVEKKLPEKKEFNKVLKKKYEPHPHRRETETPPLRQKTRSNSNLKRTEEKSVSSFTKIKTYYEDDDFFEPSEASLQKALAFRKNKLTKLYWQKFLTILMTTTNRKIQAAWFLRIRNLLRKGLIGFMQAVELKYENSEVIEEIKEEKYEEEIQEEELEEEEEEEESENMKMMMEIAKDHYETSAKINVFNNLLEYFVQSHEEGNMYAQYRENYIKRQCFIKWFEVLPKLKEDEDENFELAYEPIIQKFRFIMLAEKSLRQWRNHIAEGGKNQPDDE